MAILALLSVFAFVQPSAVPAPQEIRGRRRACAPLAFEVRQAQGREIQPGRGVFNAAASLCAEALFEPESQQELAILVSALSGDLTSRFSTRGRNENALLLAEDESADGSMVGCVSIEACLLTPDAQSNGDELEMRPLLSSLAVSSGSRRRGIAKR